jgi:hypothetical protein
MKHSNYLLIMALLAVVFACKNDDGPDPVPPTEAEKRLEILIAGNGTWNLPTTGGVTLADGSGSLDITELFENFTVKFTEAGYTTTGTTPVWARSGTWEFKDDSGDVFVREDGLEVTVIEITETSLKFSLEWDQTTYEEGRPRSLAGTHTFTLGK